MSFPITPTHQVLSAAVGGSGGISGPPTTPSESHRFYQCVLKPAHTACVQMNTRDELRIEDATRLILIPSWIPSIFDTPVIHYTLWSDHKTTITGQA